MSGEAWVAETIAETIAELREEAHEQGYTAGAVAELRWVEEKAKAALAATPKYEDTRGVQNLLQLVHDRIREVQDGRAIARRTEAGA